MGKFEFKKVVALVAFLALAGFSCFWTAESLFIWQPSLTKVGSWFIAVIFYLVASMCFSMFLKSFDRHTFFPKGLFSSRTGHLVFGLLGIILFWLVISLPTNTHTLLYRATIKDIAVEDLTTTIKYLQKEDVAYSESSLQKLTQHQTRMAQADSLLLQLGTEATRPDRTGFGERCRTIVGSLSTVLGQDIHMLNNATINGQVEFVRKQVGECKDQLESEFQEQQDCALDNVLKIRDKHLSECEAALDDVNAMVVVDMDVIDEATRALEASYPFIRANLSKSKYESLADKERYCGENMISKTKAMRSVPDVWKDYLTTDKYDGHGFIWWVLIALLVDLSAFIFFDIVQKKNEDFI